MKRYVYKNRMTGHWMVDTSPRRPGNVLVVNLERQGYRRWQADERGQGALTEAVAWAEDQRRQYEEQRRLNRIADQQEADYLAMLPEAEDSDPTGEEHGHPAGQCAYGAAR